MPDTLISPAYDSLLLAPKTLFDSSGSALPLTTANNILANVNQPLELTGNQAIKVLPLASNGLFPPNNLGLYTTSQSLGQLATEAKSASNSSASDIVGLATNSADLDILLAPPADKFRFQETNSYLANTDSKSLLFSPYNWLPTTNGIQTSDAGAYLKFNFNGTQAILDVDTSNQTSFPLLDVFVDGKQTADQL
jgi:hypothetical protein